jgi:hypothetical protein
MSTAAQPQGAFIMLWAGEDPALHSALLEELQSAGIPFMDKPMGDDEVAPTAEPLPIDWKARFGFEVVVRTEDYPAAQPILEKLLGEEPADLELPAQDSVAYQEPPLVYATETHPVVEVWAGTDEQIGQFLIAALQENEIPMHLEDPGGQTKILVSAANEARAREIVREIVEAAPPE